MSHLTDYPTRDLARSHYLLWLDRVQAPFRGREVPESLTKLKSDGKETKRELLRQRFESI